MSFVNIVEAIYTFSGNARYYFKNSKKYTKIEKNI